MEAPYLDKNFVKNLNDTAEVFISRGFTVFPVKEDKTPMVDSWSVYKPISIEAFKKLSSKCWGMALCMGGKKKLTAIDFDLKYDLTGNLFDRYKSSVDISILKKMNVNTTKNRGYHLIFSCPVVEANQVLAARPTTLEELEVTFEKNRHKGILDASRAVVNDTKRVLIETRGEGGYILIPPSFGYKSVYGKLNVIKFQEYNELMEAARSFNEVYDSVKRGYSDNEDLIEAFNKDNVGLDILTKYGWTPTYDNGKDVRLLRPGNTYSKSSALFDRHLNKFYVFSTSSVFRPNTAYDPFDILCAIEFGGNVKKAVNWLENGDSI